MRILIDMDGVLCNLMDEWLRRYNAEYGDALSTEQITSWGPHRFAKAGRRIYKYLSLPGFFRDLVPLPGAVENMRRLLAAGFDVPIVTAASGHQDKRDWVSEHLPFFNTDNMIFAHRKELIRGDILFDDAPHHPERFSTAVSHLPWRIRNNAHVPYRRIWDDFTNMSSDGDRPVRFEIAAGGMGAAVRLAPRPVLRYAVLNRREVASPVPRKNRSAKPLWSWDPRARSQHRRLGPGLQHRGGWRHGTRRDDPHVDGLSRRSRSCARQLSRKERTGRGACRVKLVGIRPGGPR